LPFILISGDLSSRDLPDIRDGTVWFLLKSFTIETFLEALREALAS
jgi:hypothetical protein